MPATIPLMLLVVTANLFGQIDLLLVPLGILTLHFALLESLVKQPLTTEQMQNYLGIHRSDCGVLLVQLSESGYISSAWRGQTLYWHVTTSGRALAGAARHLVKEKIMTALPDGTRSQLLDLLRAISPPPPKLPPQRVTKTMQSA